MPVDERKNHLREALAQKSTEELDDLLAISFSEQAVTISPPGSTFQAVFLRAIPQLPTMWQEMLLSSAV